MLLALLPGIRKAKKKKKPHDCFERSLVYLTVPSSLRLSILSCLSLRSSRGEVVPPLEKKRFSSFGDLSPSGPPGRSRSRARLGVQASAAAALSRFEAKAFG